MKIESENIPARFSGNKVKTLCLLAETPMTLSEIGRALDTSSAAITGMIDSLEKAGLVIRGSLTGDRRVWLVELTSAGRKIVRGMQANEEVAA